MTDNKKYCNLTAPSVCDTPSYLADLLASLTPKQLEAGNDEGMYRLRILKPYGFTDPLAAHALLRNAFNTAVDNGRIDPAQADISEQRYARGECLVICSPQLPLVLETLRVQLRHQAHALSL